MPPPITETGHALDGRRAKVRIGVAAVLLVTAIGILTLLSHRKPETALPEETAPPPAPQTSMSSTEMEPTPPVPEQSTPPAAPSPMPEAEVAATPPPPPVPGQLPEVTRPSAPARSPAVTEESAGVSKPMPVKTPTQTVSTATAAQVKPSTAAAPQPSTAVQPKQFEVQLGVFTDLDHVKQFQEKLTKHGIPSHTETRVQIGPFKTRAEADQAREKLKTLGITSVVIGK